MTRKNSPVRRNLEPRYFYVHNRSSWNATRLCSRMGDGMKTQLVSAIHLQEVELQDQPKAKKSSRGEQPSTPRLHQGDAALPSGSHDI